MNLPIVINGHAFLHHKQRFARDILVMRCQDCGKMVTVNGRRMNRMADFREEAKQLPPCPGAEKTFFAAIRFWSESEGGKGMPEVKKPGWFFFDVPLEGGGWSLGVWLTQTPGTIDRHILKVRPVSPEAPFVPGLSFRLNRGLAVYGDGKIIPSTGNPTEGGGSAA